MYTERGERMSKLFTSFLCTSFPMHHRRTWPFSSFGWHIFFIERKFLLNNRKFVGCVGLYFFHGAAKSWRNVHYRYGNLEWDEKKKRKWRKSSLIFWQLFLMSKLTVSWLRTEASSSFRSTNKKCKIKKIKEIHEKKNFDVDSIWFDCFGSCNSIRYSFGHFEPYLKKRETETE